MSDAPENPWATHFRGTYGAPKSEDDLTHYMNCCSRQRERAEKAEAEIVSLRAALEELRGDFIRIQVIAGQHAAYEGGEVTDQDDDPDRWESEEGQWTAWEIADAER